MCKSLVYIWPEQRDRKEDYNNGKNELLPKGIDKENNVAKANAIYETMASKYPSIAGWVYNTAGNGAADAGLDDMSAQFYQKTIDLLGNKENRDADETGYLKQAYQLIGYYYWVTKNDLEAAKPYYQKLIVIDPNDKNANAALNPAPAEGENK